MTEVTDEQFKAFGERMKKKLEEEIAAQEKEAQELFLSREDLRRDLLGPR